jgi:hypothetical protein
VTAEVLILMERVFQNEENYIEDVFEGGIGEGFWVLADGEYLFEILLLVVWVWVGELCSVYIPKNIYDNYIL